MPDNDKNIVLQGGLGRGLARELRALHPDLLVEGVDYSAGVGGNMTPGGADPAGVKLATSLYQKAASMCPNAALVGGGYSQGAALQHRTVEALPKNIQNKVVAVVLYGDTKNKQDGGRIKNFPTENVKIFCNKDDGVCGGGLQVNAGHMAYRDAVKPGAEFAAKRIKAYLTKGAFSA
jgi:cutinase